MNPDIDKEYLINFILLHSHNGNKEKLDAMNIDALVMIKIQIELELTNQIPKL